MWGALTLHAAALADETQNASTAQALFDQGIAEMEAKHYETACPKLEEATRLMPSAVGAKEQLAQCFESWGRLASAWAQWNIVAALSANGPAERHANAETHAESLKPRLATLVIDVDDATGAIPGILIKRDGIEVGRAQWGSELPVDAGTREITVTAPHYAPSAQKVEILGDGVHAKVTLRPLVPDDSDPPTVSQSVRPWQAPLGIAFLATGGGVLAIGAILGGFAIKTKNDSNAGPCNEATNRCSDEGLDIRDQAFAFANGSTALFVIGGAFAGAGLITFLTAPKKPSNATPAAALMVGPGSIDVLGVF